MMDNRPPDILLARRLNYWAAGISIVVMGIVALKGRFHIQTDFDFSFLPKVYSTINAIVAVLLIYAVVAIKNGKRALHQRTINIAMGLSALFLVLYVVKNLTTGDQPYCGTGWLRGFYLVILISHIVLAIVSFPLILFTYIRGYTRQWKRHRAMAKWVFPIWLYVAITGPLVYIMLYSACDHL